MQQNQPILQGKHIRLEPLSESHIEGLVTAARDGGELYCWSPVPATAAAASHYVRLALAARDAGTAVPFATIREDDNAVIGSTRFWETTTWNWPSGHLRHGRTLPDVCEIGYTWLTKSAIRTAVNSEAKLLMLTHAFETWGVLRVCFHTDMRNERSRAAITRLGAKFEGVLRAHRFFVGSAPRDSARFSIVTEEWPAIRERLGNFLMAAGRGPARLTGGDERPAGVSI